MHRIDQSANGTHRLGAPEWTVVIHDAMRRRNDHPIHDAGVAKQRNNWASHFFSPLRGDTCTGPAAATEFEGEGRQNESMKSGCMLTLCIGLYTCHQNASAFLRVRTARQVHGLPRQAGIAGRLLSQVLKNRPGQSIYGHKRRVACTAACACLAVPLLCSQRSMQKKHTSK